MLLDCLSTHSYVGFTFVALCGGYRFLNPMSSAYLRGSIGGTIDPRWSTIEALLSKEVMTNLELYALFRLIEIVNINLIIIIDIDIVMKTIIIFASNLSYPLTYLLVSIDLLTFN